MKLAPEPVAGLPLGADQENVMGDVTAMIAALDAWLDLTRLQQTKHQPERAWLRDILRAADADPLPQIQRSTHGSANATGSLTSE